MACACGAAEACEACWQAWPSGAEVSEAAILRACRDRRQSGAVERLLTGAPGGAARAVLCHAPALSCDVFGSHVVQCALAAVGRGLAAAASPPRHLLNAVAATAELLSGSAFNATAADACGTHVARALLLLLAGSCPARRTKKSATAAGPASAKREDPWPATAAFTAPPELHECLRRAAEAAAAALSACGTRLSCDTHAAPVLATLLRACAAAGLETQVLQLLAALALPDTASACRVMAASPGGSRVLEAALATAPPAALDAWLSSGVLPNAPAWLGSGAAPTAAAAAAPSISFILAADGSARSFKPGHDESQWWCRRDAHARIAAAALWCAGATSCSLLYADASMIAMHSEVTLRCVVPTEAALVALWRDAAAGKRVPGVRAWRPDAGAAEAEALQAAFANLLAPLQHARVCVCLLHEDYAAELPVWGRLPPAGDSAAPTHVVFVGGAVRDLTPAEAEAAEAAARARGFAFVGANLGRVPEFSSKVVATLGVHHANGRAVPAVAALVRKASTAASAAAAMAMLPPAVMRRVRAPVALRFVLRAPFAAAALNTAPEGREALQPTLRAVVAALWRSRLADEEARRGEHAAAALAACHVLLCFDGDGAALSIGPDFVARLAAAHAAAPSEHQVSKRRSQRQPGFCATYSPSPPLPYFQQVLAALEAEIAAAPLLRADAALRAAAAAPGLAAVLELHLSPSTGPPCADLAAAAYADRCACSGAVSAPLAGDVLAFLDCEAPAGCGALRARLTPPAAAATPAAAACFLQQLHYHGRLAPALALAQAAGPAVSVPAQVAVHAPAPLAVARGASAATARCVFAAALDAARTEAQLQPLVAAVAAAALPPRDAAAAAVLAAAARAARRIGACHDAAAAAAYAGRDASGLWRALLCGGGGSSATLYEQAEPCDAGAALLSELLLLPPAGCTAPLRAGFRALLRQPGAPALRAWAQSAAGSRALEAALGPSCAALPPRLRRRAARSLLQPGDALPPLCLHPKASWVVAALWDAMQGGRQRGRRAALRAAFHAQLAAVPQLQVTNPRLWTRCGMDRKHAA